MFAIVEIAGLQYKVEKDQQLYVNRLKGEMGEEVSFDRVLLTDGGSVQVGAPVIDGMSVTAKILEHVRGDKIIVFKKKRRKGYRVKNGHRQHFTKIEIVSIAEGKAKPAKKKEEKKAEKPAEAKAEKPAEAKTEKTAEVKKAAPKKAEEKKEEKKTAPKAEEKKAAPKAEAAKKPAAKKPAKKKDDLKLIEGIGPKSAEALVAAGVDTFEKLSKKTAEEIKEILSEASSTLAHLDPETWAKQAEMAAEGKLEELKKWQDELHGGKEIN